ncbi:MAG: divergent polysaccharide deacetylase family protein [Oricola sp.]
MNDLNAPLGQTRGKPGGNGARSPRVSPRRRLDVARGVSAASLFAVVAGLNAYALAARDSLPDTAPITLAEAAPAPVDQNAVTGTVAAAPQGAADGVKVAYGEPPNGPQDGVGKAAPQPDPGPIEGRISEGGPKIIVVRDPSAASVGQPLQVAYLPDDDALESSEFGDLPVRTADGRRPMDIYARPWSTAGGKRIAVVIGGLGLSQTGTQRALKELPPEITLAFAPQGNSLQRWMTEARKAGHELLVQVPMEPFDYPRNDPGPQTLTVAANEDANLSNLRWALGQITNYTGIVNYLGGRFATDDKAIGPVLKEIGGRGLLYMNDGTAGGENLASLAHAYDVPYVTGQVVLDATQDPAAINARLKELEKIAEAQGTAIGTGSAFEATVGAVAAWANGAKKRGFEIVGVSALAR